MKKKYIYNKYEYIINTSKIILFYYNPELKKEYNQLDDHRLDVNLNKYNAKKKKLYINMLKNNPHFLNDKILKNSFLKNNISVVYYISKKYNEILNIFFLLNIMANEKYVTKYLFLFVIYKNKLYNLKQLKKLLKIKQYKKQILLTFKKIIFPNFILNNKKC